MARAYSREYIEWLEENNYSQEDEQLILRTATGRVLLWFLLSCIPTLGIFFLPLMLNAWTMRRIIKQKSFSARPGLLYSFCALAMYITFIMIIPWIEWTIVKKYQFGSGIRGLIKKGKIGSGGAMRNAQPSAVSDPTPIPQSAPKKRGGAGTVILILILLLLAAAVVLLLFFPRSGQSASNQPALNLYDRNWAEIEPELQQLGIAYTVTFEEDLTKPANTVLGHTRNKDGTVYEVLVVSPNTTVPDFSAANSEAELAELVQSKDLVLKLQYMDADGNLHDTNPGGEFAGIETSDIASGTVVSRGSAVTVTVRIQSAEDLPNIAGQWHICSYDGISLDLEQLTLNEDGTFYHYGMGYLSVDMPTDLYLYGKYWSGAMGASEYSGTYAVKDQYLTLTYNWYDYNTNQNIPCEDTYVWSSEEGRLYLTWDSGSNQPAQMQKNYTAGLIPEGTNPDPISSATGIWYYFEEPEVFTDNPGGHTHHTVVTYLTVNADGTCSSFAQSRMRSSDGWFFPGGEWPTYFGTCTFDGSVFDIHYTSQLEINRNDQGNYLGETRVPCDVRILLTVQMHGTMGTVLDASGTNIAKIGRLSEFPEPGFFGDPDAYDISAILDQYVFQ